MLKDKQIREIVDYPDSHDVFSGVDVPGGICYFLWENGSSGLCKVTNVIKDERNTSIRALDDYPTFVRFSQAIPIIRKVFEIEKKLLLLYNAQR